MSYNKNIHKFNKLEDIKLHLDINEKISKYDHKSGYVYLIKFNNNCLKIGSTKSAHIRIKAVLDGNLDNPECIYVSNVCNNYKEIETEFKRQFKKITIKGTEWFKMDKPIDYYSEVLNNYNYHYNFMTKDERKIYLDNISDKTETIFRAFRGIETPETANKFNNNFENLKTSNFDNLDMFEILVKEMKNQRDKIKDQDNKIIELESKFDALKDALA